MKVHRITHIKFFSPLWHKRELLNKCPSPVVNPQICDISSCLCNASFVNITVRIPLNVIRCDFLFLRLP